MQIFRQGVINVTRIAEVLEAYEKPTYDWGAETAYRLFNAATFALNGRVMESPGTTGKLHKVVDDLCETAFWDKCARPIEQQAYLPLN